MMVDFSNARNECFVRSPEKSDSAHRIKTGASRIDSKSIPSQSYYQLTVLELASSALHTARRI